MPPTVPMENAAKRDLLINCVCVCVCVCAHVPIF